MSDPTNVERARRVFVEATVALEEAAFIAAVEKAVPDLAVALSAGDRLIASLKVCLDPLQRIRRRTG
jgi:hypothetical protein